MRWWPFSKMYRVPCPAGHDAFVFKNIDDAIPLSLKASAGAFNLRAQAQEVGEAGVSAEYKNVIEGLLFAIDDRNNSQVLDFRNAYLSYMSNPCKNGDVLTRTTERIMDDRSKLQMHMVQAQTFIAALKAAPQNASEIIVGSSQLLQSYGVKAPQLTEDAIYSAVEDARKMVNSDG